MAIKLIIESKQLLTELKWNEVLKRFKSKKFLRFAKKLSQDGALGGEAYWKDHYSTQPGQPAFERYLEVLEDYLAGSEENPSDFIPEDIEDKEKAEALNWLISVAMKAQALPKLEDEIYMSLELFYQIKNEAPHLLKKNKSLMTFEGWRHLEVVVVKARYEFMAHRAKKEEEEFARKGGGEGVNLIYEDQKWSVYIPETQMAARFLGRGTTWCTATNPKTSRNHYHVYHTKESPLYIFISKADPTVKYQFSYMKTDFATRENKQAPELKFLELNEIIKKIGAPVIAPFNLKMANNSLIEHFEGGYRTKIRSDEKYFNNEGKLHRVDGPAMTNYDLSGRPSKETWFEDGIRHREGGPAVTFFFGDSDEGDSFVWFYKGYKHREGGPAEHSTDSISETWYDHGSIHREDGPAITSLDWLTKKPIYNYYLYGEKFTKEEFETRTSAALNESLERVLMLARG
jgi:hypothetical protein